MSGEILLGTLFRPPTCSGGSVLFHCQESVNSMFGFVGLSILGVKVDDREPLYKERGSE